MRRYGEDFFLMILVTVSIFVSAVVLDCFQIRRDPASKVFGVTYMTMNNPFYVVLNNEVRKQVEANGDSLMLLDPLLDVDKQIEQVERMIEQNVDGILLNPVDSTRIGPVLEKAQEKGIPVVIVDSPVDRDQAVSAAVVSDNYKAGVLCAQDMMAKTSQADILLLEHAQVRSARDRIRGFLDTIAGNDAYQVVDRRECYGQLENAMPQTAAALAAHPEVDVIMALNDPSALGASAAAESCGRTDLMIYGVDGTPEFKTSMKTSPWLEGTVAQSPITLAKRAAECLYKTQTHPRDGGLALENHVVDVFMINQDNLDSWSLQGWQ